ncbi:hypothetical protein KIKIMORA_03230 [Brevundimonas phage vB_BpoS-Kikimora]|uniref:Holin n=1 Tax=Brevundimonas phage vB_BpoS-Kikimora TaxID=2948601 RepID=A0A9E7MS12_9CAUD|nr:hypothetical protein KIKIMORA_03230 [Brevundimonas phage vB_BpoS-Kikimora]
MTDTSTPEKPAEDAQPTVHLGVAFRSISDQFRATISLIMMGGGLIFTAWLVLAGFGWVKPVSEGLRWAVIGFGVYWFLFMGIRALMLDYLTARSALKTQRLMDAVQFLALYAQLALQGAAKAAEDAHKPDPKVQSDIASSVSYLHDMIRKRSEEDNA